MGHLLAPVSMLLPLALYALERSRHGSDGWLALAGAALASIPLSGQVHLALGADPVLRRCTRCSAGRCAGRGVIAAVLAAVFAGLAVYVAAIRGSVGAGGRSFDQVERYSADLLDFVARDPRHGLESAVFLGWLLPLLALVGLVALVLQGRYELAAVLADRDGRALRARARGERARLPRAVGAAARAERDARARPADADRVPVARRPGRGGHGPHPAAGGPGGAAARARSRPAPRRDALPRDRGRPRQPCLPRAARTRARVACSSFRSSSPTGRKAASTCTTRCRRRASARRATRRRPREQRTRRSGGCAKTRAPPGSSGSGISRSSSRRPGPAQAP